MQMYSIAKYKNALQYYYQYTWSRILLPVHMVYDITLSAYVYINTTFCMCYNNILITNVPKC